MSNLIKSAYFNVVPKEERIIDSDQKIPVFLPEILNQKKESNASGGKGLPGEDGDLAEEAQESLGSIPDFQTGLNIVNMDDILNQEREKVAREISEQAQQMLEDARVEADRLLEDARAEAVLIRQNALEEGRNQGLEDGFAQARDKMEQEKAQFQQEMESQRAELEEEIRQMEPRMADIMIALVEKLIGIVCQDKKKVIVYLIDQALHHMERAGNLTLRVSQEDLLTVTAQKESLMKAASGVTEFNLVEDASLESGQCIIETDNKLIDCSLDVQLQNLQEQIRLLTTL